MSVPTSDATNGDLARSTAEDHVTRSLEAARRGDGDALGRVLSIVYDELRAMADRQLGRELHARSLEPTALVHEAYFKLVRGTHIDAVNRSHLLALAANAMRQVLVDRARRRRAVKRQGDWQPVTLTDAPEGRALEAEELLMLDDALGRLEARQRQIVECRFFGGMQDAEIATLLGVTDRTVRREWVKARARLNLMLYGAG